MTTGVVWRHEWVTPNLDVLSGRPPRRAGVRRGEVAPGALGSDGLWTSDRRAAAAWGRSHGVGVAVEGASVRGPTPGGRFAPDDARGPARKTWAWSSVAGGREGALDADALFGGPSRRVGRKRGPRSRTRGAAGPRRRRRALTGLIVAGNEGGGIVSEDSSFILLQAVLGAVAENRPPGLGPRRDRPDRGGRVAWRRGRRAWCSTEPCCWRGSRPCPTAVRERIAALGRGRDDDVLGRRRVGVPRVRAARV